MAACRSRWQETGEKTSLPPHAAHMSTPGACVSWRPLELLYCKQQMLKTQDWRFEREQTVLAKRPYSEAHYKSTSFLLWEMHQLSLHNHIRPSRADMVELHKQLRFDQHYKQKLARWTYSGICYKKYHVLIHFKVYLPQNAVAIDGPSQSWRIHRGKHASLPTRRLTGIVRFFASGRNHRHRRYD
jgi:hypothetical protein